MELGLGLRLSPSFLLLYMYIRNLWKDIGRDLTGRESVLRAYLSILFRLRFFPGRDNGRTRTEICKKKEVERADKNATIFVPHAQRVETFSY